MEQSLTETKVPWIFHSRGAKVPHMELSLPGVPGSESSCYQLLKHSEYASYILLLLVLVVSDDLLLSSLQVSLV